MGDELGATYRYHGADIYCRGHVPDVCRAYRPVDQCSGAGDWILSVYTDGFATEEIMAEEARMKTFKKQLDKILIGLGEVILSAGTALLGANLGDTYAAVDRLHRDSGALDRLEYAGQITDVSLIIMMIGGVVLAAGIVLLVRRLARS